MHLLSPPIQLEAAGRTVRKREVWQSASSQLLKCCVDLLIAVTFVARIIVETYNWPQFDVTTSKSSYLGRIMNNLYVIKSKIIISGDK